MTKSIFPYDLPIENLLEIAVRIQSWFDEHEHILKIRNHHRFRQMCRTIIKAQSNPIDDTNRSWRMATQALRDLQELWFCIVTQDKHLLHEPFLDTLRRTIRDDPIPDLSKDRSQGRDAQFELLVASLARRAGLSIERPTDGNYDWKLRDATSGWAIECKRPKSEETLDANIRIAIEQLSNADSGGVIAIDFGPCAQPGDVPLQEYISLEMLEEAHRRRTEFLATNLIPRLQEIAHNSCAGLLLMYDTLVIPAGKSIDSFRNWSLNGFWHAAPLRHRDTPAHDHFERLRALLLSATPQL